MSRRVRYLDWLRRHTKNIGRREVIAEVAVISSDVCEYQFVVAVFECQNRYSNVRIFDIFYNRQHVQLNKKIYQPTLACTRQDFVT